MKTTTSGRAFAKNIFDLFATLMISLPIETHKSMFKSYPNSFTAEEAIRNLRGLQFIQAHKETDPKDPTRIITRVVTTQFSLAPDMAKNLCQTFMDARLCENAVDPGKREFQSKGVYQVTGKGAHIVEKFVHRNSLSVDDTRHITANATPRILFLERTEDEDAIVLNQKAVDAIFKRFAGLKPNTTAASSYAGSPGGDGPASSPKRDRVQVNADRCNGIEVKDQQHNYDMYRHTFYGKAAVEWLLDYTTVISKEEAIRIAQEMVTARYIEQVGEEVGPGPSLFRSGNSALYHFTELGRAVVGWESFVRSRNSSVNTDWMDEKSPLGPRLERSHPEMHLLSTQFKLTSSTTPRLPISVTRERQRSTDESSLYNGTATLSSADDTLSQSSRRLSQILNDPALQFSLSDAPSNYAPSSTGKESVGYRECNGSIAGYNSSGGVYSSFSTPITTSSSQVTTSARLNLILSNLTLREMFKSFLKQNICEENLSFYLEVLDYKSRFNTLIHSTRLYAQSLALLVSQQQQQDSIVTPDAATETTPGLSAAVPSQPAPHPTTLRELEKQICTQAFAIHETYLILGAPKELNLPHQMRQDITTYMQAVVRNMEMPESTPSLAEAGPLGPPQFPRLPSDVGPTENEGRGSYGAGSAGSSSASGSNTSGSKELIHISLFDRIHEHVFRLMSTDSVPKFIRTD
ncbi:hypothetical protein BGZ83_011195, partial [Gryganskiella cystojenkinii]